MKGKGKGKGKNSSRGKGHTLPRVCGPEVTLWKWQNPRCSKVWSKCAANLNLSEKDETSMLQPVSRKEFQRLQWLERSLSGKGSGKAAQLSDVCSLRAWDAAVREIFYGNTKLLFGFPRVEVCKTDSATDFEEPAKCCWLQIFSSHGGCYAFIGSQMLRVAKFSLATEVWLDKASGAYWAWEGLALWLWAGIYCIMWQMIVAEGLASRTSDKLLDDWKARPYCTDLLCGRAFDICSSWTRLPGMVASCLLARPGGKSCNAAATPG